MVALEDQVSAGDTLLCNLFGFSILDVYCILLTKRHVSEVALSFHSFIEKPSSCILNQVSFMNPKLDVFISSLRPSILFRKWCTID